MHAFFRFIINTLYVLVILFVVITFSISAFMRKQNLIQQYTPTIISGEVVKQEIPVLSDISGSVHVVKASIGQHVSVGDPLFEITPIKLGPLTTITHVLTAQTDGVVEKIVTRPGNLVSLDTPLAIVLSDDDMKLAVNLTDSQYRQLIVQKELYFYSQRLDQSFAVSPSMLDPVEQGTDITNRTVTAVYTFVNPDETNSLLQNESLQLVTHSNKQKTFALPTVDLFSFRL